MIRKSDVNWWALEATKHPEAAAEIIEQLAQHLLELDEQNERLREELHQAQQQSATADASQMATLRREITGLRQLLDRQTSSEPSLVLVSSSGQAVRVPMARAADVSRNAAAPLARSALRGLARLLLARPHDRLLLLSSRGRGWQCPALQAPLLAADEAAPASTTGPAPLAAMPDGNELLTAAVAVGAAPRFWTVVTRRGWVKQYLAAAFERDMAQGAQLFESPVQRDVPVGLVDGDPAELVVFTRWGRVVRFPQRSISAQGDIALDLEPDDEVVAALPWAGDGEVVLVTASGAAMRRSSAHFECRVRPGGDGRALIQAFDLLAAMPYQPNTHLLLLAHSGRLVAAPAGSIALYERLGKGTQLADLTRDPAIGAVLAPDFPGS